MTSLLLALAILAGGALGALLTPRRQALAIALSAMGIAGVFGVIAGVGALRDDQAAARVSEWSLPLGVARLALDGLSGWFLMVIGVVTVPTAVYSWGYFSKGDPSPHRGERPGEEVSRAESTLPSPLPQREGGLIGALLCVMVAAMILVVSAADAVLFLVGWELMSLSAFLLVGYHDQDADVRHGAWMYLVATHIGTAIGVLPLFAAFVARSGSMAFAGFAHAFSSSETAWCVALFVLGVIGFGTKAGFMPFHVWLPAAHPVAPSPVSALMSGVVIKTGIYGLLRLLTWLPDLPVECGIGLAFLAIVTGVMGILYAVGQRQIKRMLAYSSVENTGIIGIAIALSLIGRSLDQPALVVLGLGGALLHVLNHSLFKGLLFLSAGAVLHDTGTGDIERLGGLARRTPVNALAFLVGAVAICAIPPLNGFLSEFLIYIGLLRGLIALPNAYSAVTIIATAALALIGGLALVGFSKVFSVSFLGETRDRNTIVHPTPRTMNLGMMLLAAACVAVSLSVWGLAPIIAAAMRPLLADVNVPCEVLHDALTTLARVALPLGILVVIAIGLLIARRRLPAGAPVGGSGRTWGCGFTQPLARMQYSGSSYAWSLVQNFRQLVRPVRESTMPAGSFPDTARLSTRTRDAALKRMYEPVFSALARAFERLWPLQHGRIQLYLVYIVVTVIIVFIVEAALGPVGRNAPAAAVVVKHSEAHP